MCVATHDAPTKRLADITRHNHMTLLACDIDEGNLPASEVCRKLGYLGIESWILYSTATHQAPGKGRRWRLLVELSKGVPVPLWRYMQRALAACLGGDKCSDRPTQVFFLPNMGAWGYEDHQGSGPPIDPDDGDHVLVRTARIHELGDQMDARERKRVRAAKTARQSSGDIDAFNAANTVESLLDGYGFKRCGSKWKYPGAKSAAGVTVRDGRYYSYHSKDPLSDGRSHDAFDLFVLHEHGGDINRALRALRSKS
jgi:hypothetical protein